MLDYLVGLIDGEVKLGYHRTVGPRPVNTVAKALSFLTRQEPHDESYRDDDDGRTSEKTAPIVHFCSVYSIHFSDLLLFTPRKYEKITQKSKKMRTFAQNLKIIIILIWKKDE